MSIYKHFFQPWLLDYNMSIYKPFFQPWLLDYKMSIYKHFLNLGVQTIMPIIHI